VTKLTKLRHIAFLTMIAAAAFVSPRRLFANQCGLPPCSGCSLHFGQCYDFGNCQEWGGQCTNAGHCVAFDGTYDTCFCDTCA
jgi:hypothetical protein